MRRSEWSDEELVAHIMEGGENRKIALSQIYRNSILKTRIMNYIRHKGYNETEVVEIYTESLLAMDRSIRRGNYEGSSSLSTFLFSVAKYTALNYARRKHKVVSTVAYSDEALQYSDLMNPELSFIDDELKSGLERLLSLLNEKCKVILNLWSNNASYDEIARKLGVEKNGGLRKQKLVCLRKLEDHLRAHPELIPAYYNRSSGE